MEAACRARAARTACELGDPAQVKAAGDFRPVDGVDVGVDQAGADCCVADVDHLFGPCGPFGGGVGCLLAVGAADVRNAAI